MNSRSKRKEVWLTKEVIDALEVSANKKQWSLKQYMEFVLNKDAAKVLNGYTSKMSGILSDAINLKKK